MLIAILGDIHANIDALTATLDVLDRMSVDKIICAGDVVGYCAAPGECIDLLRNRGIQSVCGNHDQCTFNLDHHDNSNVREEASTVFSWTHDRLRPDQLEWLGSLPKVIQTDNFMVIHSSCQPHPNWTYVTSPSRAALHFLFQKTDLCFNAHSHVPLLAMHRPGQSLTMKYFHNLILPRNVRIMIGVGAVGQPRDDDPRAAAILYNTTANSATLLRIKYDVDAAQKRILDAGLPSSLASRLALGK